AHYSEASLIKALEENGVGRPSTYAATIETLKAREYAKTEKRKLIPLERGILVCDWLVKKLGDLFSVGYTSRMEAELDKVAEQGEPMNQMLSEFYATFMNELGNCAEPPPDPAKFDLLFELLSNVREWKPSKKMGKRIYDDKAFVDSVRAQAAEGKRPLSARQLDFLVRMVVLYADQIPDAAAKLREAGLGAGSMLVKRADPELVRYCFEAMDRIGGMDSNPFLKSLREQVDHGKGLSMKQFAILAKSVGDNAGMLDDCEELRARLAEFVPGGFGQIESDPAVPGLLDLLKCVKEWRQPAKRGKKVYDDKTFVESLAEQFARRHSLSMRQTMALRRVVTTYRDQIPEYEARAEELGLQDKDGAAAK
ncbi:MAG: hypothetical protein IJI35_07435, partial [Kiritimatiellae bacterium]|nr:hypothetical protein [Kiritimatiellia bacterium]